MSFAPITSKKLTEVERERERVKLLSLIVEGVKLASFLVEKVMLQKPNRIVEGVFLILLKKGAKKKNTFVPLKERIEWNDTSTWQGTSPKVVFDQSSLRHVATKVIIKTKINPKITSKKFNETSETLDLDTVPNRRE